MWKASCNKSQRRLEGKKTQKPKKKMKNGKKQGKDNNTLRATTVDALSPYLLFTVFDSLVPWQFWKSKGYLMPFCIIKRKKVYAYS